MLPYTAAHFAAAFRTVRKNTIQIAEDIPAEKYDFTPGGGARTVADLLAHIAVTPNLWKEIHSVQRLTNLEGFDFFAFFGQMMEEASRYKTKPEILDLLRNQGEQTAAWLEAMTEEQLGETVIQAFGQPPKVRFEALLSIKEHEMHHRGQLMLMQRMLGIVPHLTRQMEEFVAKQMAGRSEQPTTAHA